MLELWTSELANYFLCWMSFYSTVVNDESAVASISEMSRETHTSSSSKQQHFAESESQTSRWKKETGRSCSSQITVKARTETRCFISVFPLTPSHSNLLPVAHFVCSSGSVALQAWLPSRLWSSGVKCNVRVTEMWPSPTWRLHSGTGWLFVR